MYHLKKEYRNHYGLDLKSSDLDRPDVFASDLLNSQYKKDGSLEKRRGYRGCAESTGGHGLAIYNRIDENGITQPEVVSVSNKLHKLEESSITITYSGAGDVADLSLFFDPTANEYKILIVVDNTTVLDRGLGLGFDEASVDAISDLDTAINALTDFSSTTVGATTVPSAFLTIVRSFDLTSGTKTLTACRWSDVNTPLAAPLAGSETNKDDANFENVSFTQLSNVLFVANGYDNLQKYDGQNMYRAGLPKPDAPGVAGSGGGTGVDAGAHDWKYVYVQKDAVDNIVEGDISALTNFTVPGGGEDVNVTVDNIVAASGFNTNCAIVAGAQVTVTTITVDDGSGGSHTLLVGDTAYFFDSVTGDYVEREVTSVAASTITIAGAAVTVADNAVISNNLRIGVYRSLVGGTFVFQVAEIPNNSFAATQVFLDDVADASLGIQFIDPVKPRGLPPKGKYIAPFYNQLIIAGDPANPNTFYWSDITSPEHHPFAINNERAESSNGDPISGVKQSNEVLAVFEKSATHVYNGDFTANNIRGDIVSHKIGCVAHHTIQQLESELRFLSEKGVYKMVSGQIPDERSNLIQPLFTQSTALDDTLLYKFRRALAVVDTQNEKYICFIPTETTTSGEVHTNDNYIMVVEDYSHNTHQGDSTTVWLKWRFNGTNPAGGAIVFNKLLHFVERRYSSFNSSVDHVLYREMNTDDPYDYQDNANPVLWNYSTAWYALGEPSVFKKWIRLKCFAIAQFSSSDTILDITTEVNYVEGPRNELTMDLASAGSGYGLNQYGIAPYGDVQQPNIKSKLNAKAKSLRIIYENEQDQRNLELTGWELEIAAPFRAEIKE